MAVKLKGLKNVRRALETAREIATGKVLLAKLQQPARAMISDLQRRAQELAPVEEGTLRGEARSGVTFTGADIKGHVTFGGLATQYAEVQHEREDFQHPKGGQAHFLHGPGSAWEKGAAAVLRVFDREVGRIADRHIQDAAGGAS